MMCVIAESVEDRCSFKYLEFFFRKYCLKSKYQNMGKIFENYSRRNSSLKTKQKIKLFTEVYSTP